MKDKVLGIDIGGTKIRAVLWPSLARWNGRKILRTKEIKTPKSLTEFKGALKLLVHMIAPQLGGSTAKLGVGVPGRVRGNVLVSAANLPYIRNLDLGALFKKLNIENIKIDHDARCFARAEVGNAAGKLLKNNNSILFLTLGTGIGRAFAKNGKILKIKKFEYPERWEVGYQKIRDLKDDRKLTDYLSRKLEKLIKKYNPDTIVIGGGVSNRKNFIATFQHSAECWNVDAKIIKSKISQNSVAIGAALLYK